MDVVCFSFDCTFNEDGSSNCTTIAPKHKPTTTYKPTFQPTSLSTRPTPPTTGKPTNKPSFTTKPTAKPAPTKLITTRKPTTKPTTAKPAPTKLITTRKPTERPTAERPTSHKSSVATPPKTSQATVTLPRIVTSDVTNTTTDISTSSLPMGYKVTSPSPVRSAAGMSVYIPCSVVGFILVVVLLASIGIVRRYRKRRRSLEARYLLSVDSTSAIPFDPPPFTYNNGEPYSDPTSTDVPIVDATYDTEENEVERLDILEFSSEDSDDLENTAPVPKNECIFDKRTVRKQRKRDSNGDKVV